MEWIKKSNRWKHLVCGIILGAGANDIYCAAYTGISVASALELKDKLWGAKWDWIDWSLTLVGIVIGFPIRLLVLSI